MEKSRRREQPGQHEGFERVSRGRQGGGPSEEQGVLGRGIDAPAILSNARSGRLPVILGSRDEVRLARYHREHQDGVDQPFSSPLFNRRSLFTHG